MPDANWGHEASQSASCAPAIAPAVARRQLIIQSLITDADRCGKDLKGAATLWLGCRVHALEAQQKYVLLEGDERVDFDVLVLATGAEPKRSRWPESDLPNVHVLRTLEDADAIIESSKGGRQVARALFRSRDGVRTIPRGRRQSLTRARFPGSEV
jgi:NADPH-dependent 2,4-dienoyl-CoA reductase/sulfur reductase-like enzyme